MTVAHDRRSTVARYAALAAAVYLAASLVALTLPALLGGSRQGLAVAGGVVILLTLGVLPAALVARTRLGIAPSVLITGAMVLAAQVALVALGALGVPGLLPADGRVPGALMDAVTFALLALVPAATAAVCTSAGLRVWRAWRARRDGPAAAGSAP